jgi:hypothetical protein
MKSAFSWLQEPFQVMWIDRCIYLVLGASGYSHLAIGRLGARFIFLRLAT